MCLGAELIHKSSDNSGAPPRIENYAGLRIDSSGLELSIGQYVRSNVGWLKHT